MNVLAIDTCLGALSVAVGCSGSDGSWTVTEHYEALQGGHAERLMPAIAAEMARSGLGFADLQRIAVTLGPGTFTGVRTGIAAARALRLATGLEVVGLTSLAVMAHAVFQALGEKRAGRPVMIAVDARRERLYVQLFGESALDPLTDAVEVTMAQAAALAGKHPVVLAGSGARAVASAGVRDLLDVVRDEMEPHAADLAALASRLTPLCDIAPIYLRQPDAKPQADKRLARTT